MKRINSLVDYFKGLDEVSALYVLGEHDEALEAEYGLGVLAHDDSSETDSLSDLELDCIMHSEDDTVVFVLNNASLPLRHYVATKGQVVFDRELKHRLKFAEEAFRAYEEIDPHVQW